MKWFSLGSVFVCEGSMLEGVNNLCNCLTESILSQCVDVYK